LDGSLDARCLHRKVEILTAPRRSYVSSLPARMRIGHGILGDIFFFFLRAWVDCSSPGTACSKSFSPFFFKKAQGKGFVGGPVERTFVESRLFRFSPFLIGLLGHQTGTSRAPLNVKVGG